MLDHQLHFCGITTPNVNYSPYNPLPPPLPALIAQLWDSHTYNLPPYAIGKI